MYIGFSASAPLHRYLHLSSRLCSHLHLHLCLQVLRAGNAVVRGARWAAETGYAVRCLASLSAHADGLEQLDGFVPLVCSALRRHAGPRYAHAPCPCATTRHAMLVRHAPRRVSCAAPHTARALSCMCTACALHVHCTVTLHVYCMCTAQSHCMCTACALHSHTACALRVYCMCTACALHSHTAQSHCMCTASGRAERALPSVSSRRSACRLVT